LSEPGRSTKEIDDEVYRFIIKNKAKPAFLGYHGFPASICISVNEEVVHGIPLKHKRLREGQIVSFDTGTILDGFFGDSAKTVPVGSVSPMLKRLMEVTRNALYAGIQAAKPNNRIGDIGAAIQSFVEKHGFSVVRDFVGHCIGRNMHEEPQIPNFGMSGTGLKLKPGMVLAIEPMVNAGHFSVHVLSDRWTVVTDDGKPSAHFEHVVAVLSDGPEILSE
jgi:methionyl aminopeptidase